MACKRVQMLVHLSAWELYQTSEEPISRLDRPSRLLTRGRDECVSSNSLLPRARVHLGRRKLPRNIQQPWESNKARSCLDQLRQWPANPATTNRMRCPELEIGKSAPR